jgi:hypothetical protein
MDITTIDMEYKHANAIDKKKRDLSPENAKPVNSKSRRVQQAMPSSSTVPYQLRTEDIDEHRLWTLATCISCFFLIAPLIAYHHIRRIRTMKKNQELIRAKRLSDHVNSLLTFSNIVGGVIWTAIIFVIGVFFVLGFFL